MLVVGRDLQSRVTLANAKSNPSEAQHKFIPSLPRHDANRLFPSDIPYLSATDFVFLLVHNPWSSLIPLSRGSFDVIVGMDWWSKRKFVIVCHEMVVRILLEGDEILRVHGDHTQGVVGLSSYSLMDIMAYVPKSKENMKSSFEVSVGDLKAEKLYFKFLSVACSMGKDWESSLTGVELVQETTNKVMLIKENLKAARDCQKSYVGNMRKHLELKLVIK
ncbi:hypothetical protein Tco_0532509 [Tanacetum coccineum]